MKTVENPHEEERLGAFDALFHLRRLMGFTRGSRRLLAVCIAGSLLSSAVQVVTPLLVRFGVDRYMDPVAATVQGVTQRVQGVTWLAVGFGGLLAVNLALSYLVGVGLNRLGQRVVASVRTALWRHLHRLPIRYFDTNPVGRLVARVANDTNALAEMFTSVLASGVGDLMMFCGVLAAVIELDARLAAMLLTLFVPLVALVIWFRTTTQRLQRSIRDILARLNAFFQENIQGIAVVKSFTAEQRMVERFQAINAQTYEIEMRNVRVFAIFRPLVSACSTLGVAIVLWWGAPWVLEGRLSAGTLVAFLMYVRMLFGPVDELAEKFNILQQALVASERLLRILDTPAESTASFGEASSDRATVRAAGRVTFEDVWFAYDPDKPVLSGISFEIQPGETVALVGPSGSGKTTVASLLLGFYRIEEGPQDSGRGRIMLDGIPIEAWDVRALRRQIALVSQDLFLFSTDLRRNITLFETPTEARLAAALEASRASRVAEKFDDGLDHPLNERGTVLSQGERQLISFARALVVDPPVLVLDEATASVDSKTEALIQDALRRVLAGRTALVVAHRLSTVQEADRILVLSKGRIMEQGTHAALLAADGLYAHMYRTQQLGPG